MPNLMYLYFGGLVNRIEKSAFEYCLNLEKLFIYCKNEIEIEDYAFYGCHKIKQSDYENLNLKLGYKAMYD